jgi:hypothetical protein
MLKVATMTENAAGIIVTEEVPHQQCADVHNKYIRNQVALYTPTAPRSSMLEPTRYGEVTLDTAQSLIEMVTGWLVKEAPLVAALRKQQAHP